VGRPQFFPNFSNFLGFQDIEVLGVRRRDPAQIVPVMTGGEAIKQRHHVALEKWRTKAASRTRT
jgi:hypothetical protein